MQSIFERYEKKYLITEQQHKALERTMSQHMVPDVHGTYLVQNLYYDTEHWDVIRASLDKPAYKEKMRLRCYGMANKHTDFFLELKKKYKGIVYKRRIAIPAQAPAESPIRTIVSKLHSQIAGELAFYLQANNVAEKIYISYRRTALAGLRDGGLRITFDTDILFRINNLRFADPHNGQCVLPDGKMLMEIKMLNGMPLWLAGALSENEIFPTNFSKYGVCYTAYIGKQIQNNKEGDDLCLPPFQVVS